MKKILFVPVIITLLLVSFFSCKKETIITEPATNIHDTICIEPTKQEILTQKTWQIDELYRCYQGVNSHFVRGGENTTGVSYGNLRLTFVDGGTGTYVDEVNTSHTLSWDFLDTKFQNANLTIGAPFPNTFTWNLIEIHDNYLHNTSIANVSGSALMLTARYIQVP